jgi:hypothetical protein
MTRSQNRGSLSLFHLLPLSDFHYRPVGSVPNPAPAQNLSQVQYSVAAQRSEDETGITFRKRFRTAAHRRPIRAPARPTISVRDRSARCR